VKARSAFGFISMLEKKLKGGGTQEEYKNLETGTAPVLIGVSGAHSRT
jgi:hypothetical protein